MDDRGNECLARLRHEIRSNIVVLCESGPFAKDPKVGISQCSLCSFKKSARESKKLIVEAFGTSASKKPLSEEMRLKPSIFEIAER
jgi:hypothetical protein